MLHVLLIRMCGETFTGSKPKPSLLKILTEHGFFVFVLAQWFRTATCSSLFGLRFF